MTDHDSSVFGDGAKTPDQPGCGGMVERGARVLEPQAWAALGLCDTLAHKSRRTSSLRKARAFIEAMREPTEAMVSVVLRENFLDDIQIHREDATLDWRAMIDAALSPQPEPVSRPTSPNTDKAEPGD